MEITHNVKKNFFGQFWADLSSLPTLQVGGYAF